LAKFTRGFRYRNTLLIKSGKLPDSIFTIPLFHGKNRNSLRQLAKTVEEAKIALFLGKNGFFGKEFSIFRNEQVRGSSPLTSTSMLVQRDKTPRFKEIAGFCVS
jgi:hypothetical protein